MRVCGFCLLHTAKQFVLMFGNLPKRIVWGGVVTFSTEVQRFYSLFFLKKKISEYLLRIVKLSSSLKAEKEAEVFCFFFKPGTLSYLPFPLVSSYSWEAPWCLLRSLLGTSWSLTDRNILLGLLSHVFRKKNYTYSA